MISTQRPAPIPHMHVLYSNMPATSRRAHNVPFLLGRAAPSYPSQSPSPSQQHQSPMVYAPRMNPGPPYVRPTPTRRAPPPPRRNAISYHPSQPFPAPSTNTNPSPPRTHTIGNPFADPPAPMQSRSAPVPRRATLISSGYTSDPLPLIRPHPPRDHSARLVAKLLLNRAGRARPMRGPVRRCGSPTTGSSYVRSGLSVCLVADEE
ncbi:hypothetical protein OF83DRAFT_344612 [Amylostereum chailletii]|nr:hypothetical protein OF83DRAFT_344612 [Amylostereum chailletii]